MPERRAISSSDRVPSDWLSTHSSACSRCAGLMPPTAPYSPRLPSRGSPLGLRLTYWPLPSRTVTMRWQAS